MAGTKKKATEQEQKWLRAKQATDYFKVSRNTLNKIAIECDARKKMGAKVVIYDVERINRYLATM